MRVQPSRAVRSRFRGGLSPLPRSVRPSIAPTAEGEARHPAAFLPPSVPSEQESPVQIVKPNACAAVTRSGSSGRIGCATPTASNCAPSKIAQRFAPDSSRLAYTTP